MSKQDWYELAMFLVGNVVGWLSRHWGIGATRVPPVQQK